MSDFEKASIFISIANLLFVLCWLGFSGWQALLARKALEHSSRSHEADHLWHQRIAAQDALSKYGSSVALSNLQKHFGYIDQIDVIDISVINEKLLHITDLRQELHNLLNYYEGIARGVKIGIYDEEVIRIGRKNAIIRAFFAFMNYIHSQRISDGPQVWCELENLVVRWSGAPDIFAQNSSSNAIDAVPLPVPSECSDGGVKGIPVTNEETLN